jgi:hypothetical protein
MTHISTHPPDDEMGVFSNSPALKMFGFVKMVNPENPSGNGEFQFLFFNNTGYVFPPKDSTPIKKRMRCHLLLFPLNSGKQDNILSKIKKQFFGLVMDLGDYEEHAFADGKANTKFNRKIERLNFSEIGELFEEPDMKPGHKKVLIESMEYMNSDSFKRINSIYEMTYEKQVEWMKKHVLSYEDTKQFVFGCGNRNGNQLDEKLGELIKNHLTTGINT